MLPCQGDWVVIVLASMIFLAPAIGVPNVLMLQDTLKSMVVSFGTLTAALLLFWLQRKRLDPMQWHGLMWLPLLLMAYALGSMVWSHTYLAGVEAIRWFVFTLLLWVGMNTLTRERVLLLASAIHWGAVLASLWAALQFWVDFRLFPQEAYPGSTFINRNFFAEFVVCTIPFSVFLLARARGSAQISLRAFFTAFNLVAIMMAGTRSALLAILALGLVLPVILYLYRAQFEFPGWGRGQKVLAIGALLCTFFGLGSVESGNPRLIGDQGYRTALGWTFSRTISLTQKEEFTKGSASQRLLIWKATGRMIQARPLTGVGAGAWEVDIPLYQSNDTELEIEYYAHNELLQLLAEYGLVGWLFILALLTYLTMAAWKTWRNRSFEGQKEAPIRALTLACLLAFLIVSNAGFPWRLAGTGALFALALAILAASDARLGIEGRVFAARLPWNPKLAQALMVCALLCLALAAYISQQAAECESKIVRAINLAYTVSHSGNQQDPRWDATKEKAFQLVHEGVAINPHYRKITVMVADSFAQWGDWKNAIWVWESVAGSRPNIVAILSHIAVGYIQLGNYEKATEYLARAKAIRPNSASLRSLEVVLLSRSGKDVEAVKLTKGYFKDGIYDYDLTNVAYLLGLRTKDWPLAIQGITLRMQRWPALAADAWFKIGNIYASSEARDDAKALEAYRSAMAAIPEQQKETLRQQIPAAYRSQL